jgi:hypothetical protein
VVETPKERVDVNLSLSHCGCIFFWLLFTGGLFVDLSLVTVPGSFYRIEQVGTSTSTRFKSRPVNRLCWMRVLWLVTHRTAPDQASSLKLTMNASSPVLSSSPIAIMISCYPTLRNCYSAYSTFILNAVCSVLPL